MDWKRSLKQFESARLLTYYLRSEGQDPPVPLSQRPLMQRPLMQLPLMLPAWLCRSVNLPLPLMPPGSRNTPRAAGMRLEISVSMFSSYNSLLAMCVMHPMVVLPIEESHAIKAIQLVKNTKSTAARHAPMEEVGILQTRGIASPRSDNPSPRALSGHNPEFHPSRLQRCGSGFRSSVLSADASDWLPSGG